MEGSSMTADDDLKPGDRATWMRVQRGGYGYVVPVPCTIEQVPEGGGRVRIRVVKADGDIVYRHVAPESLRAVRR